jgi:hypothetical protein
MFVSYVLGATQDLPIQVQTRAHGISLISCTAWEINKFDVDAVGDGLQMKNNKSQVTNHKSQTTDHKSQMANHK